MIHWGVRSSVGISSICILSGSTAKAAVGGGMDTATTSRKSEGVGTRVGTSAGSSIDFSSGSSSSSDSVSLYGDTGEYTGDGEWS
ncbi:hypothetical protein RJT34_20398 [Clitoria ternatea]|uniref:Uncharacterized protein n=1 Tax=Clitoria ternatea TaxID=43366 RepID=A0AAN9ISU8_CLITE